MPREIPAPRHKVQRPGAMHPRNLPWVASTPTNPFDDMLALEASFFNLKLLQSCLQTKTGELSGRRFCAFTVRHAAIGLPLEIQSCGNHVSAPSFMRSGPPKSPHAGGPWALRPPTQHPQVCRRVSRFSVSPSSCTIHIKPGWLAEFCLVSYGKIAGGRPSCASPSRGDAQLPFQVDNVRGPMGSVGYGSMKHAE